MKLNWGNGIAIFYICFMIAMIFMVVKSAQNRVDLVQENYYEKDLNYEAFRQSRANAKAMVDPIQVSYLAKERHLSISFPSAMQNAIGEIALFRPSNKYMDKKYHLKLDDQSQMTISLPPDMRKGLWYVKVDWIHQDKSYYSEQSIVL